MAVLISKGLRDEIVARSKELRPKVFDDMKRMYASHIALFSEKMGLGLTDTEIAARAARAAERALATEPR
jgi:hypothetical protein